MRPAGPATATAGADAVHEGIVPTLAELVALRAQAQRAPQPRQGRHGVHGPAPSKLRGRGMEYAESREYTIGDDVRRMDWRLTARSGRAHTKLFQAERERLTLLVADTAPELYFGTRVRFKSVQAARAGAVAVWSALQSGDRIAALRGASQEAPVAPASGQRGALRVLDALVRWYARPPEDDAGLAKALEHARRLLRPGSRVIVLADPASVLAVPTPLWAGVGQHHDAVVLLLTDPLERRPPVARLPFSLGGERLELALDAAAVRQRWQQAFDAPMQAALALLQRQRIRAQPLSSDDPTDAWLALLDGPAGRAM